jgi:hypothetical protein
MPKLEAGFIVRQDFEESLRRATYHHEEEFSEEAIA